MPYNDQGERIVRPPNPPRYKPELAVALIALVSAELALIGYVEGAAWIGEGNVSTRPEFDDLMRAVILRLRSEVDELEALRDATHRRLDGLPPILRPRRPPTLPAKLLSLPWRDFLEALQQGALKAP